MVKESGGLYGEDKHLEADETHCKPQTICDADGFVSITITFCKEERG